MNDPTVCCVLLVNGRAEMVRRAIASFRAQTYERKRLLIWDTTPGCGSDWVDEDGPCVAVPDVNVAEFDGATIGKLRNKANKYAAYCGEADIIAHFDSDDYSHPRRLEEQVALLLSSGKQCVGYRELLFWDTRQFNRHVKGEWQTPAPGNQSGEAWIYRNHQTNWAAGASLMYRRELWERQPFPDAPHEDQRWWCTPLVSCECIGLRGIGYPVSSPQIEAAPGEPRMICQMHAGGTEQIPRKTMCDNPDVWRRAPEFDELCERTMRV